MNVEDNQLGTFRYPAIYIETNTESHEHGVNDTLVVVQLIKCCLRSVGRNVFQGAEYAAADVTRNKYPLYHRERAKMNVVMLPLFIWLA